MIAGLIPLPPFLPSCDSDGVVGLPATRAPGLSDHVVVHASHALLLASTEVADNAFRFLANGAFAKVSKAAA
jgi:hypothetical protein